MHVRSGRHSQPFQGLPVRETSTLSAPSRHHYEARGLDLPAEERIVETRQELIESCRELDGAGRASVLVGDGQHLRHRLDGAVALRTEGLHRIVSIDRHSGLVRAEAGVRWRDFQDALHAEGLSAGGYALQPSTATLGGLLARFRPGPKTLGMGSLRDGCVALSAFSPESGSYDYLVAPRKAAGPDLRYLFIGAEGRHGPILEATLIARRPLESELLIFEGLPLSEALGLLEAIYRAGLRWQWMHYGASSERLQIALSAPGALLRGQIRWIEANLRLPDAHLEVEALRARRRWLEDRHPARRAYSRAERASGLWCTARALENPPLDRSTPGVDDLTITAFTPDRVELVVEHHAPLDVPMPGVIARWPLRQNLPLVSFTAAPTGTEAS
ncbi:FAD-binding oxidoreductase [Bradymonadaceae bacterium TMQ3]|nr:FAD-binding oxidoreductase [Bradymonadaceae bacterium TMQ3]TXC74775.1 FAD-binding oxidoreductase [Bradymonadales bacterium TMQ1]